MQPRPVLTGFIAHTQYFDNDLQTVGKEHVLMPVGGASVPSTCRREDGGLSSDICHVQLNLEDSIPFVFTMCVVRDHERIRWPSTHIFQEVPWNWRENVSFCFSSNHKSPIKAFHCLCVMYRK